MPSLTRQIPHNSDQARRLLSAVKQRVLLHERRVGRQLEAWRKAEETALAYLPEREVDTARRTARENGLPQYTTIQIPYSYAVLMTAHTYWTSVFLARNPAFQYTGRHGESQQKVQALEAIIDYQVMVGRHMPVLYTWLYDVGKYGHGILGLYWCDEYTNTTSIEMVGGNELLSIPPKKVQTTRKIKSYSGNKIYNIDPNEFIWDPRVPLKLFQTGEFAGVRRKLGWNEVVRRQKQGYYFGIENISMSATPQVSDSRGSVGSDELDRPDTDFFNDTAEGEGIERKRPQVVGLIEMTIELIPKEWGLSGSDEPEKWVLTVTRDYKTLIGVQPHGAYHGRFPYIVLSCDPEGYGLTNRGVLEVLEPVQNTVDWLLNSHFFNVRAALNNRYIVDPSRLVMKDLLDPKPGGIVRLKPLAYGTDPKLTFSQVPITDVTQGHIPNIQAMIAFGERAIGVNDQLMGMLNAGGGRKTATEVRTSTTFGVNRLKTSAEYFSATGWDDLSRQMVQNTQQYYDGEWEFKVAGDLLREAGMGFLKVTPDAIAGYYDFVPVDGTLPIDRYAQANLWRELMTQMQGLPEVALTYDWGRIFEWVAGLAGLKNVGQFKVQVAPDAQLMQQAKLGNMLKLNGRRPPNGAATPGGIPTNLMEPGQVSGMGATG